VPNLAKFTIEGTASSPGGYDATVGQTLHFALEGGPASLVNRWTLQVYDPADTTSPLASYGAPLLSLVGATTGQKVDAATPGTQITCVAPSGMNTWIVRSIVNGGILPNGKKSPDYVWERMLAVRDGSGRRRVISTEQTQYGSEGWARAVNEAMTAAMSIAAGTQRSQIAQWNGTTYGLVRDKIIVEPSGGDDTAAIQSAVNARAGVTVELAEGNFNVTSTIVINLNGVTLRGRGIASTFIYYSGAGASCKAIQLLNCQGPCVHDLQVLANGAAAYSADALIDIDGCYRADVQRVLLAYGYRGIHVYRSTETWLRDLTMSSLVGDAGVLFEGTVAAPSFRCDWIGGTCGLGLPAALGALRGARTISTLYAVGDLVTNGGYVWQCTVGGTSGVGGGPVAVPGAGSLAFSTQVTDGTAKWQFVHHANHAWLSCGSYCNTLRAIGVATVGGGKAVYITDPANTGSSFPDGVHLDGFESDRVYVCNALIDAGFESPSRRVPVRRRDDGQRRHHQLYGEGGDQDGGRPRVRGAATRRRGERQRCEDRGRCNHRLRPVGVEHLRRDQRRKRREQVLAHRQRDRRHGAWGSVICATASPSGRGCDHYEIGPNRLDGNVTGGLLDSSAATATDRRVGLNTADEFELKTISQTRRDGSARGRRHPHGHSPTGALPDQRLTFA
jgi:hypothetical protein